MVEQLGTIPCITELPENYRALWELCLADVWCPASVKEWRERIDSPNEINTGATLFVNLSTAQRRINTSLRFSNCRVPFIAFNSPGQRGITQPF